MNVIASRALLIVALLLPGAAVAQLSRVIVGDQYGPTSGLWVPPAGQIFTPAIGQAGTITTISATPVRQADPECAVTLTLPKGDVPVPDNVDVVVSHATPTDGSVSASHCKISVRQR